MGGDVAAGPGGDGVGGRGAGQAVGEGIGGVFVELTGPFVGTPPGPSPLPQWIFGVSEIPVGAGLPAKTD